MEADKLLIVAHPDDEILWGGGNLLAQSGWFVLCSTHLNDPVRSKEFYNTMSYCNVNQYVMCDVEDTYTDDPLEADRLYDGSSFDKALKNLSHKPWKLVLSHNESGEYGHEHHRKVHRMVRGYFPGAKFFNPDSKLPVGIIERKRDALLYYRKTQDICKKIFNKHGGQLRASERSHFFNEQIYVKSSKEISPIVHQIWFGKPLAADTVRFNLMKGVKDIAHQSGFIYKCWTNDDLTPETLPLTFEFIQLAMKKGEEHGQSRFAQVADLARIELLHRFGGIYLDSLFEIGSKFLAFIHKNRGHQLVVANEDPCKLDCKGAGGKPYMSNGFFACVPGCVNLKRLLNYDVLENVDFDSQYINQTTGPYFFRSALSPRDDIVVLDTELIYPFMVNDSEYRKGQPNGCITTGDKLLHNCLEKKYKHSLTVYHSGFGGSWSW